MEAAGLLDARLGREGGPRHLHVRLERQKLFEVVERARRVIDDDDPYRHAFFWNL
jgi:hypothetical protein